MDLFPDGAFVRLRSRAISWKYLHADGDWAGVSLRRCGRVPSLEAVWRVEHWVHEGVTYLRLQSAAYGRYLALSGEDAGDDAPSGHLGLKAAQRDIDDSTMVNFLSWRWRVERVKPLKNYVRLRHFNRDLRANGRLLMWNNGVTVDFNLARRLSTMMQWTVHPVAATSVPLPFPAAPPAHQVRGFVAILSPSSQSHCIGIGMQLSSIGLYIVPCIALLGTSIMDAFCLKLLISSDTRQDY